MDEHGVLTDRRAGRISTDLCVQLVNKLREHVHLDSVEVFIEPVREYRFAAIFRGDDLEDEVEDTDPLGNWRAAAGPCGASPWFPAHR